MNEPDDMNSPEDDLHTGYDLETGLLARAREWTDVFPWIRLARTLRVAGSPVMVGLVALTFMLWWNVHTWIIQAQRIDVILPLPADVNVVSHSTIPPTVNTTTAARSMMISVAAMMPVSVFDPSAAGVRWTSAKAIAWALLVWMPVTLFLVRQGALLTAGRELVPVERGLRRSLRLTPVGWLIAVVPLGCLMVFALMICFAGWVSHLFADNSWLAAPTALAMVIVAIPVGLLGFGAYVAVPLGWAALANEQDPDSLDSLSRGYEYLYRRPLKVFLYAVLSLIVLAIVTALATGIAKVATDISTTMLTATGAPRETIGRVANMLSVYPQIVSLTLFWALVGGVYLLLRHDAGQQEVEDIWQPTPPATPSLPELPRAAETPK